MKISCQSCQAKYTIADEKVLGKIVKIRCKKCGATIVINGNESGAQTSTSTSNAEAQAFDYGGATSGDQWTVNVADGDQRTMTQDEILAAYKSGVVNDETYCWKDGMADWLPIREVPELYAAASSGGGGGAAAGPDQTQHEPPAAGLVSYAPPSAQDASRANGRRGAGTPATRSAAASERPQRQRRRTATALRTVVGVRVSPSGRGGCAAPGRRAGRGRSLRRRSPSGR